MIVMWFFTLKCKLRIILNISANLVFHKMHNLITNNYPIEEDNNENKINLREQCRQKNLLTKTNFRINHKHEIQFVLLFI